MTRTFWMSFADETGWLGVCVVDVEAAEAEAEKPELAAKFPKHRKGAEWLSAATRKAWRESCNPGGQIGFQEIPFSTRIPRNRLLTRAEVDAFNAGAVH